MCWVFSMYLHFDMFEKSVRNGINITTVYFPFILISKEEREMDIEREFATLSE